MEWSIKRNYSNIIKRDAWFLVGPKEEPIRVGRIWGGLSWPGVKAGYLVVMAQADSRDGRPLYLALQRYINKNKA